MKGLYFSLVELLTTRCGWEGLALGYVLYHAAVFAEGLCS